MPRNQNSPGQSHWSGKVSTGKKQVCLPHSEKFTSQISGLSCWQRQIWAKESKNFCADVGRTFVWNVKHWAVDSNMRDCTTGLDTAQLLFKHLPVPQVFGMQEPGRAKITGFPLSTRKSWQMVMPGIELFANWGGKGESPDMIKCDQNNSLLLSS